MAGISTMGAKLITSLSSLMCVRLGVSKSHAVVVSASMRNMTLSSAMHGQTPRNLYIHHLIQGTPRMMREVEET